MSDDRFKQARRSLIDRHNQRQQQGGWDDSFADDDFEDEATAMVNLDGEPAFAPPPNFAGAEPEGARTEMFQLDPNAASPPPPSGVQMRTHSGVQPSYDSFGGSHGGPPASASPAQQSFQPSAPEPVDPNQSLVIGPATDFEGNTAFINLNDFAQGGESFTPDNQAAGYEGNTQFVNIGALQAGGPAGPPPIDQDPVLKQGYMFGPESVQQGEFTLVFAQNHAGQPVVLKRIWEGDPNGMPIPVRQRVAALDQIKHPRLVGLTGMVAAPSGAWVELSRPPGYRLTDILQNNGPQDPNVVKSWIQQTAEVLEIIHQQSFVYANMTTDALWIQDDGSVVLEPFDVLAFEPRGSLGVFGPPELGLPPDQRQPQPATDVYSLAAVMTACLTGLPLNLGAIQSLDKKTAAAIGAALQQNPQQRPPGAMAFAASIGGRKAKGGAKAGSKVNAKIMIPAIVVIGCLGLAGAYFLRPKPKPAKPPQVVASQTTGETNGVAENGEDNGTAGTTNGAPPVAVAVASAGDVETDPRLTIKTSFATNPATSDTGQPSPEDLAEASEYREEAREYVSDLEGLAAKQKRERYAAALGKLALAVRLSGGMTAADEELLADLSKDSLVQEIKKDYFERLDDSLKEERLSSVKQVYPQLAAVDAEAKETRFFVNNKAVRIKTIEPIE